MSKVPDTLRHSTKSTGQSTQSSIERIAVALVQERSVGRGAGGWRLGSREAVAPEMDTFFVAHRFLNPKTVD